MLRDHPVALFANKRPQDRGSHICMIVAAQRFAYAVQQRAQHVFVVTAVFFGKRRATQRVRQPVYRKTTEVAVEQLEVREDTWESYLRSFLGDMP